MFSFLLLIAGGLPGLPVQAQVEQWKVGEAGLSWGSQAQVQAGLVTDGSRLHPLELVSEQNLSSQLNWLRLRGTIFQASVFFTGYIFDTQSDGLPQTITPGDANPEVFSNTIQMRSSGSSLQVLKSVAVHPRAITPNGDLVNDRLQVGFGLFGVEQAIVSIQIFDLTGHRIARLQAGPRKAGNYLESWDGRDDAGELVRPGIYLVRLEVEVDRGTYEETHPVTVVY